MRSSLARMGKRVNFGGAAELKRSPTVGLEEKSASASIGLGRGERSTCSRARTSTYSRMSSAGAAVASTTKQVRALCRAAADQPRPEPPTPHLPPLTSSVGGAVALLPRVRHLESPAHVLTPHPREPRTHRALSLHRCASKLAIAPPTLARRFSRT